MSHDDTAAARPNVILLLADDLGWGDLGCYGATAIPTPVIDALAARGVRYTDAHASSAVCTPSRYSILTGEYPWRSPLQKGVLGGTDPSILRPGQTTLATALRDEGYRTGAFGKWHLGLGWSRKDGTTKPDAFEPGFRSDMQASGRDVDYTQPFTDGPLDHGFERFFGIAGSLDMPPYCFLDQDRTVGIPDREKHPLITSQRAGLQVEGWQDDRCDIEFTERACAWIRDVAAGGAPFFAYVAAAAPHRPCVPPHFVQGLSEAGARGDSVCLVDWMLGQLLRTLEECGAADDTIVVVTSDNGAPTIFPEDGDVVGHRPNGPWRGQKADAWEGGHRVPLIIAGPGYGSGLVSDVPVSLVDLLPTLSELPEDEAVLLDGIALTGEGGDAEERLLSQQAFDGALVLRVGAEKVILSSGSGGFSAPEGDPIDIESPDGQFYRLDSDPSETRNLWVTEQSRARAMYRDFVQTTRFGEATPHAP